MTKRILVVPDVHGRTFWKEPVKKYLDQVDRVVFLGDYLDPYRDENVESEYADLRANLMEIIGLKQLHQKKVILLKGNHDQHYYSRSFNELAGGTRQDKLHWNDYYELFHEYKNLFQIAHLETIKDTPYLFSHAGVTVYWMNKVNFKLWQLPDNEVSIASQDIIDRINLLDTNEKGQVLLSIIGESRTWFGGEKTGSILWADVEDHPILYAPKAYGLDKVFQVFGHTRLSFDTNDMVCFENFAMIDTQQCFMIDERIVENIMTVKDYEKKYKT